MVSSDWQAGDGPPEMIKYFENRQLQAKALVQLYINAGVDRPITDLARTQKMIDHSNLTISAWEGNSLVGIARAVSDFGYCCYLSDLAVDQHYQGMGIGKSLITIMQKKIGPEVSLILMASPEATEFYEKLGFNRFSNGYMSKGVL